jgi:hypothetical protein
MQKAIVEKFCPKSGRGTLRTSDGHLVAFAYKQGQNMMITDDSEVPQFTGHHEQPRGYRLKYPAIGDVILFEGTSQQPLVRWGYVAQHEALAARRSGKGDSHIKAA